MKKHAVIAVAVVCLLGTNASAIMGPTVPSLEQGQSYFGLDYSKFEIGEIEGDQQATISITEKQIYTSWAPTFPGEIVTTPLQILQTNSTTFTVSNDFKGKIEGSSAFAKFGHGISDEWGIFGQIGISKLDQDGERGEGDNSLAFGAGTKVLLHEEGNLKIGAVATFNMFKWSGDMPTVTQTINWDPGNPYDTSTLSIGGEWEMAAREFKIAIGPTYTINEWATIYGGPFWQHMSGEFESDTSGSAASSRTREEVSIHTKADGDFKSSAVGAYVGVNIKIAEASINIEYQKAKDSGMFGVNGIFPF